MNVFDAFMRFERYAPTLRKSRTEDGRWRATSTTGRLPTWTSSSPSTAAITSTDSSIISRCVRPTAASSSSTPAPASTGCAACRSRNARRGRLADREYSLRRFGATDPELVANGWRVAWDEHHRQVRAAAVTPTAVRAGVVPTRTNAPECAKTPASNLLFSTHERAPGSQPLRSRPWRPAAISCRPGWRADRAEKDAGLP